MASWEVWGSMLLQQLEKQRNIQPPELLWTLLSVCNVCGIAPLEYLQLVLLCYVKAGLHKC